MSLRRTSLYNRRGCSSDATKFTISPKNGTVFLLRVGTFQRVIRTPGYFWEVISLNPENFNFLLNSSSSLTSSASSTSTHFPTHLQVDCATVESLRIYIPAWVAWKIPVERHHQQQQISTETCRDKGISLEISTRKWTRHLKLPAQIMWKNWTFPSDQEKPLHMHGGYLSFSH